MNSGLFKGAKYVLKTIPLYGAAKNALIPTLFRKYLAYEFM